MKDINIEGWKLSNDLYVLDEEEAFFMGELIPEGKNVFLAVIFKPLEQLQRGLRRRIVGGDGILHRCWVGGSTNSVCCYREEDGMGTTFQYRGIYVKVDMANSESLSCYIFSILFL